MEKPPQRPDEEKLNMMLRPFRGEHMAIPTTEDLGMQGVVILPRRGGWIDLPITEHLPMEDALILPRQRALEAGLEPNGELAEWGDEDLADQVCADGIDPSLN